MIIKEQGINDMLIQLKHMEKYDMALKLALRIPKEREDFREKGAFGLCT